MSADAGTQTVTARQGRYPMLPDPEPVEVRYPLISVDDHVLEPPDLFTSRLPAGQRERAPRLVECDDGEQRWQIGDELLPLNMMAISSVGIPVGERGELPVRYDDVRDAVLDPGKRVRDMDLAGVAASLNFPSTIFGFAGWRFTAMGDPEVGRACTDAYNDWIHEAWATPHPTRFIPQQIVWLGDVDVAVEQVLRNAERGFKALSFVEAPDRFGLPSLYSGTWEPLFAACAETGTVVDLHVGSGGFTLVPSPDTPPPALALLFPANAMLAAVDWLFAGIPQRHPDLRIAFSEAGIGWVPMILERLHRLSERDRFEAEGIGAASSAAGRAVDAVGGEASRVGEALIEAFGRNYWFTTLGEPKALDHRGYIGVDRIMFECDYPHSDTLWPEVQAVVEESLAGLPDEEKALIVHGNASALYRHPLPDIDYPIPTANMERDR